MGIRSARVHRCGSDARPRSALVPPRCRPGGVVRRASPVRRHPIVCGPGPLSGAHDGTPPPADPCPGRARPPGATQGGFETGRPPRPNGHGPAHAVATLPALIGGGLRGRGSPASRPTPDASRNEKPASGDDPGQPQPDRELGDPEPDSDAFRHVRGRTTLRYRVDPRRVHCDPAQSGAEGVPAKPCLSSGTPHSQARRDSGSRPTSRRAMSPDAPIVPLDRIRVGPLLVER